jgi:Immunity protein 26
VKKLKVGDIFKIPISNDFDGFGQIINIPLTNNVFIIIVFDKIYDNRKILNIDEILNNKILFLGYTMDALLYHKHWTVIGNQTMNISKIKLPYFKLGIPPDMKIVDYKGGKIRKATKEEFEKLDYETSIAPIRYENALKAFHKFEQWDLDYDILLYDNVSKSIEIVEGMMV